MRITDDEGCVPHDTGQRTRRWSDALGTPRERSHYRQVPHGLHVQWIPGPLLLALGERARAQEQQW